MDDPVRLTQYCRSAGCGCKIAPSILEEILSFAGTVAHSDRLLVGNDSRDDAAVFDLGNGQAIVSTTDFFMPIVDDPFDFGQIASVNAISDVYAMGGKPLMAIAVLGWPLDKLPPEVAGRVLEGGAEGHAVGRSEIAERDEGIVDHKAAQEQSEATRESGHCPVIRAAKVVAVAAAQNERVQDLIRDAGADLDIVVRWHRDVQGERCRVVGDAVADACAQRGREREALGVELHRRAEVLDGRGDRCGGVRDVVTNARVDGEATCGGVVNLLTEYLALHAYGQVVVDGKAYAHAGCKVGRSEHA
ncbi:MAG: selenide, water dikinase SelD, partial [Verrucomicrobia bacterium]|nr:selenide, water dikinase SelD [Verrucomicrobiota bacterium]